MGRTVVGVDEAGRGPLAGPVYAAAVALRSGRPMPNGLMDSKKLSAGRRQHLSRVILENFDVGIGVASVEEIDAHNILRATLLAMQRAVSSLLATSGTRGAAEVLVDGTCAPDLEGTAAVRAIVGGDAHVDVISAASIVAKVERDAYMMRLHEDFPVYGFSRNKGYGTTQHLRALRDHGICVHHRRSFAPCLDLRS